MLVLGFQELDLSTEALLYSTGTTREDAWCMAVFAGLGEKGVLYEKVSVSISNDSIETCADSAFWINFFLASFKTTCRDVVAGHRQEEHNVMFQGYKNDSRRSRYHGLDGNL
jgi:hypothetical protein